MREKKSRKMMHSIMRVRSGEQLEDLLGGLLKDEEFMKQDLELKLEIIRDMIIPLTKKKELL